MPIQDGTKTILIPKDSNKYWLTMFYILPEEFVSKVKKYLDFPRCPHDVLRTDRYDDLINDDIFVELVFDCTAWTAWQFLEVPDKKNGGHRRIAGTLMNYSGDFPVWELCYAMLPHIHRKIESTVFSFQNLAGFRVGQEIPWLTYQQYATLISQLVPQIVKEQNWQPVIDEAWKKRVPEDYSTYQSRVKMDFMRQWTHSRTKAGAALSTNEMEEREDTSHLEVEDPNAGFESGVIQSLRLSDFSSTLSERDRQILQMKMNGQTTEEIAANVGYSTHSAVIKRLQRIGEMYREYTEKEYEEYRKTF